MNLKNTINKLYFKDISKLNIIELKKVLQIRNETNIRKNMLTHGVITTKAHKEWHMSFKKSKKDFFYAIFFLDKLIGGLTADVTDIKNKNINWGFYLSSKIKINGLGASLEFKAINFFFEKFKIDKLKCFVYKSNSSVIKFHKKFGFIEDSGNIELIINKCNKSHKNLTYLFLLKETWKIKETKFLKTFTN